MQANDKKMRSFILCADDFGLTSSVNAGIIKLVEEGKLNAVSMMTGGAYFESDFPLLIKACEKSPIKVELGLHITLTEYEPLTDMVSFAPGGVFPTISSLLLKSHLKLLKSEEINLEVEKQIERFEEVTGQKPDFLDGHQHAHILPSIRQAVLTSAKKHLPENGWVRQCCEGGLRFQTLFSAGIKGAILALLSYTFKRKLKKEAIKTNECFYGINDFDKRENYQMLFQNWLQKAMKNTGSTLIMCHPAKKLETLDDTIHDPIAERRLDEFSYFSSSAFEKDLDVSGFTLYRGQKELVVFP